MDGEEEGARGVGENVLEHGPEPALGLLTKILADEDGQIVRR